MRKITIKFEIENAAFEDDFEFAIQSILALSKRLILENAEECHADLGDRMGKILGKLTDFNGNTVGEVALAD